jgi:hypothetical protein
MRELGKLFLWVLTAAALPGWVTAQDIFRCVDNEGRVTLQNTGAAKGCKRLDVQPVISLPAPPSAGKPNRSADVRPVNFPKIDSETQKARDDSRKRILEEELKAEEGRLSALLGEDRNNATRQGRTQHQQDEIRRSQSNIASLKREIALLQKQ